MFWSKHGKEITLPFLISFSKHRSPFHYRGMLWVFFFLTKTRTLPDLNSVNKQSVNDQTTCSRRVLGTSFGHVCLSTYCEWTADLGHTVVFIRAERRKQTWEESSRTSKKLHDVTQGIKKSVLFIRKKWSCIARWPIYRDKQRYNEF